MADTSIGKAYVQIIPTAKGIQGDMENLLGKGAESSGVSAGKAFGGKLLGTLGKIGIAAGVAKIFKDSIDAGADLQQSFGGLDTIYGDASDAAKKYAKQAYKAGISANDYAEQAVSFGASLKQAFGGDTTKAVEAANTAIMDMTDNAAKMGTPIENIQNAYQGFAKGNYTMLDNLKLGFGGTKEEMQRLLETAKNSPNNVLGKSFDIDNLGDVYEAIHIIQQDLGLTGVAAQEASETFSGSLGAMQSAATNLLADLAIGEDVSADIRALSNSVQTFVAGNLLPMIGNVVQQIPTFIAQIPGFIAELLPQILPVIVDMVTGLAQSIGDNLPIFMEGLGQLIAAIPEAFMSIDWASVASTLLNGLSSAVGSIWDSVTELLTATFGIELPDWETVKQDISDLWDQVKEGITGFFTAAFDIIMDDDKTITEKISALWELVKAGIGDYFKAWFSIVLPAFESVISTISTWWGTNIWPSIQDFFKATFGLELPSWESISKTISDGWDTIKADVAALFNVLFGVEMPSFEDVLSAINTLWTDIWNGISDFFKVTFGIAIPTWSDIKTSVETLWNDFKSGISGWFTKTFNVKMPTWSDIQESIKAGWEEIKKGIGNIFSWMFSLKFPDIDDVVQDLKDWWDGVVKGIGDFFTLKWILGDEPDGSSVPGAGGSHRGGVSSKGLGKGSSFALPDDKVTVDSEAIQKALSEANLTLADVDTSSIDAAKSAVIDAVSAMERAFKAAKFALPTVESSAMAACSQVISTWVATYKRLMKFSWQLPTLHGKLPIISVNMKTASSSDGKTTVSYPELSANSFKWFAEGGIFSDPTVIGIGDSKGPEAAVPLDMMWKQMSREFDEHLGNGATVTNYITVQGAEDPAMYAETLARELKQQMRMRVS